MPRERGREIPPHFPDPAVALRRPPSRGPMPPAKRVRLMKPDELIQDMATHLNYHLLREQENMRRALDLGHKVVQIVVDDRADKHAANRGDRGDRGGSERGSSPPPSDGGGGGGPPPPPSGGPLPGNGGPIRGSSVQPITAMTPSSLAPSVIQGLGAGGTPTSAPNFGTPPSGGGHIRGSSVQPFTPCSSGPGGSGRGGGDNTGIDDDSVDG